MHPTDWLRMQILLVGMLLTIFAIKVATAQSSFGGF